MNRTDAIAQFNKITKVFITTLGMVEDLSMLNHDFYLYKTVSIDLQNETIEGNYDDFKVVSIFNQPLLVTEDTLNGFAREKILEKYPLEIQLSIIGSTIERIADTVGIECDDLKEMNEYINEVKRENKIRKQFYSSNSDYKYKSSEDFAKEMQEKHEGGIQEYETITVRI